MTTASDALLSVWSTVAEEAAQLPGFYHRRVQYGSTSGVHAGIHRPTNELVLIFEADAKAVKSTRLADDTRGYTVSIHQDLEGKKGRVAAIIQQKSSASREVFKAFCSDLLEQWSRHTTASSSIAALSARLASWRRLFDRPGDVGLSREEYVGLYGELTFVQAAIQAQVSPASIISAWQGPLGTNQDFLFSSTAVEVKSVTGNEIQKVRISNARQLDDVGVSTLYLVRYAFDFREANGNTLEQLVSELRESLTAHAPDSVAVFEERLLLVGYVDTVIGDYRDWGFTLRRCDTYGVDGGFPRLVESSLPPGISEVSYIVDLGAADASRIEQRAVWERIR